MTSQEAAEKALGLVLRLERQLLEPTEMIYVLNIAASIVQSQVARRAREMQLRQEVKDE